MRNEKWNRDTCTLDAVNLNIWNPVSDSRVRLHLDTLLLPFGCNGQQQWEPAAKENFVEYKLYSLWLILQSKRHDKLFLINEIEATHNIMKNETLRTHHSWVRSAMRTTVQRRITRQQSVVAANERWACIVHVPIIIIASMDNNICFGFICFFECTKFSPPDTTWACVIKIWMRHPTHIRKLDKKKENAVRVCLHSCLLLCTRFRFL